MQRFSTVTVTTDGEEVQLLHHLAQAHCVTDANVDRVHLVLVPTAAYDELERRFDAATEAEHGPRLHGVRVGGAGPRPGILRALTPAAIARARSIR